MKTKKFKRIIALVLALTLMLALAAMTASAATARAACPACGSADTRTVTYLRGSQTYNVSGCSKISTAHKHIVSTYEDITTCVGCGRTTSTTYTLTSCK